MTAQTQTDVLIDLTPKGGVIGFPNDTLDPGALPLGAYVRIENMVKRQFQWASRNVGVTTGTGNCIALAQWQDEANDKTRIVALVKNAGNTDIKAQTIGADTYGGAVTGITGNAVADWASYHGLLYISAGTHVYSFDGSAVVSDALGGEAVYCDTLAAANDRLYLGRVRTTINNILTVAQAYDPTTSWVGNNVTAEKITNGTTITGRITPTNATTASWYLKDVYTVAAATKDTFVRYWCDLRNTSAIYDVPVKIEVYYSQIWVAGATYAVGHIRVPTTAIGNGFRYRVASITTGVAAGVEPVWPTTVGATIVDGGVTWICDGTDAAGSTEGGVGGLAIYNTTKAPNVTRTSVMARVGANPQSTKLGLRVVFGNSANATYTLTSLEMSFRDGKTDGDLNKQNRGQQFTVGRFAYDFFNQESSTSATATFDDRVYWTEAGDTNDLRGSNFYRLRDVAGKITAIRAVGGRIVVWKQNGMWVFSPTADPDIPLRLEKFYKSVGCVSPRSVDVLDDIAVFGGDSEIYRWSPGQDPMPICGPEMRELIFSALGTTGVSGITIDWRYRSAMVSLGPILGVAYVYSLETKEWSTWDLTNLFSNTSPSFAYSVMTRYLHAGSTGTIFAFNSHAGNEGGNQVVSIWSPAQVASPPGTQMTIRRLWFRFQRGAVAVTSQLSVTINSVYSGTGANFSSMTRQADLGSAITIGLSQIIAIPFDVTGYTHQIICSYSNAGGFNQFVLGGMWIECDIRPMVTTYTGGS